MRNCLKSIICILLCFAAWFPANGQPTQTKGDFAVKAFHIDLRIQVMPMPALKKLALQLSKGGINTLIMEWEGTYPFKDEPLIPNRYAYTRQEIESFINYCDKLHLDVIPLQQSFGHLEYILRNYKYAALREDDKDYSQVNPLREELARKLFTTLYKDLLSAHHSKYIHIGCDETLLLGHSEESQQKIRALGMGRLYGDYIKMLCQIVVSLGKRPVLWADIALKYPEALHDLPKETVFVDWNYGWALDRFGDHKKLMESGFEIWGAPAIRSQPDNYFLTQWQKHFNNIHDFVPVAHNLGYKGIVMTSWSTSGVYSPVFESSSDITDLYAVRRVYPISGFNMLISAYLTSLKSTSCLDIEQFVNNYTHSVYGFSAKQGARFWWAINTTPYEINQGEVSKPDVTIGSMIDSTKLALQILQNLKPAAHQSEYAHYVLMAKIRLRYLRYMEIEKQANAADLKPSDIPALIHKLNALNTAELNRLFIKLNTPYLYPAELKEENYTRDIKISLLKSRLAKLKR